MRWLVLCLTLVATSVHAEWFHRSTLWVDAGGSIGITWDRSLCDGVVCTNEHYIVRITRVETGLLAFPDIVTAVGVTNVTVSLAKSGHYTIWVMASNEAGLSDWCKAEVDTCGNAEGQSRGLWVYAALPAPSGLDIQ